MTRVSNRYNPDQTYESILVRANDQELINHRLVNQQLNNQMASQSNLTRVKETIFMIISIDNISENIHGNN